MIRERVKADMGSIKEFGVERVLNSFEQQEYDKDASAHADRLSKFGNYPPSSRNCLRFGCHRYVVDVGGPWENRYCWYCRTREGFNEPEAILVDKKQNVAYDHSMVGHSGRSKGL